MAHTLFTVMFSSYAILRELIDRIEVYETEGTGKNRTQRIAIFYRFVGYLELPEGENKSQLQSRSPTRSSGRIRPTAACIKKEQSQ